MRTLLAVFLLFAFTGCASRQLANKAVHMLKDSASVVTTGDLRFSYEVKDEFSTEYFGMVGFVLENTTHQWITIDSIVITPDSTRLDNINVTGGADIGTWFTSMNKEKQIEAINRQRLWGTISLVSTLGMFTTNDQKTAAGLALIAAGSATALSIERFNAIRNQIDLRSYFPEDHFMRTPYRIPPGLGVDKWMVLNTQVVDPEYITVGMSIRVHYNNGKSTNYYLDFLRNLFRNPNPYAAKVYGGNWQNGVIKKRYNIKK